MDEVDLHILYELLRTVAVRRDLITYGTLSDQYERRTGNRIDPHLGWRFPRSPRHPPDGRWITAVDSTGRMRRL